MFCVKTDLLEAVEIHELCYTLPGGKFAQLMLLLDSLFAAALLKFLALLAKLTDSLGHGGRGRFKCRCSHLCLPGALSIAETRFDAVVIAPPLPR